MLLFLALGAEEGVSAAETDGGNRCAAVRTRDPCFTVYLQFLNEFPFTAVDILKIGYGRAAAFNGAEQNFFGSSGDGIAL